MRGLDPTPFWCGFGEGTRFDTARLAIDPASQNAHQGGVYQQFVWAGRLGGYIDELIQIGLNQDPANAYTGETEAHQENVCERFLWAMHDASYNVLGVAMPSSDTTSGARGSVLVERYEYTPYGERITYSRQIWPTDVNNDFKVDMLDYSAVASLYNQVVPEAIEEFTGDGAVNLLDISAVAGDFNKITLQGRSEPWVALPLPVWGSISRSRT